MKKMFFAALVLLVASIMMFAACGGSGDQDERMERHLRLPFPLPHTVIFNSATIGNEHEAIGLLHANLFRRVVDPETQWPTFVREIAAEDPRQVDEEGYVWEVTMTPGWAFDDGTPINAHTMEFTWRWQHDPLLQNRNTFQNSIVGLADFYVGEGTWEDVGFEVIDDYTFRFTYAPGFRPGLGIRQVKELLSGYASAPLHPELFLQNLSEDGLTTSWGRRPYYPYFASAGMYQHALYITDQIIQFERRPTYTGPMLDIFTFDRISFIVADTEDVQAMLFETGELDQSRANARRFDEHPGLYRYPNGFVYGIFLNSHSEVHPILQDVNFRRALYWALDRDRIVGAAFPTNVPQAFLYPVTTRLRAYDFLETGRQLNYRETYGQNVQVSGRPVTQNGFDQELALHYFDIAWEANGSVPVVLDMIYSDGGEAEQMWAEAIQDAWQSLFGEDRLSVNLRSVPWVVALEQHLFRSMMDYDIVATRRVWMVLDGEPWQNSNWVSDDHRDTWPGAYMLLTPENFEKFDEMYDEGFFASSHSHADRNLRNEIAWRAEELILNDHSFLPMYNHSDRLMISPWLSTIIPNGHYSFRLAPFQFVWDDEMYAEMMGE